MYCLGGEGLSVLLRGCLGAYHIGQFRRTKVPKILHEIFPTKMLSAEIFSDKVCTWHMKNNSEALFWIIHWGRLIHEIASETMHHFADEMASFF